MTWAKLAVISCSSSRRFHASARRAAGCRSKALFWAGYCQRSCPGRELVLMCRGAARHCIDGLSGFRRPLGTGVISGTLPKTRGLALDVSGAAGCGRPLEAATVCVTPGPWSFAFRVCRYERASDHGEGGSSCGRSSRTRRASASIRRSRMPSSSRCSAVSNRYSRQLPFNPAPVAK